jgi:acyl-CoA thioesterase-1
MRKLKLVLVFLLLLGLAALLFSWSGKEIRNKGSKGEKIICFGDSVTFGYGVSPQESYPAVLAKLVKMPVVNAGVDGDTSAAGIRRIQQDVLNQKPYIVLIEFCGNDFIKDVPKEETIDNIRQMILKAQAAGAITAIVDVSAGFFLRDYRLRFAHLARETGSIFVPAVLTGIITNPRMKSDFMHPNSEGYNLVARRIYRAISPYLKE